MVNVVLFFYCKKDVIGFDTVAYMGYMIYQ